MGRKRKTDYNRTVNVFDDKDGSIIETNMDNNIISIKKPDKSFLRNTYDTEGKIIHSTDFDGARTWYVYDENNNIRMSIRDDNGIVEISEVDSDINVRELKLSLIEEKTYSKTGQCIFHHDKSENDEKIFKYDNEGRIIYSLENGIESKFRYHLNGKLSYSLINGEETKFRYDKEGRILNESLNNGKIMKSYRYTSDGGCECIAKNTVDSTTSIVVYDNQNRILYSKDETGYGEEYKYDEDTGEVIFYKNTKGHYKYTIKPFIGGLIKYIRDDSHEENMTKHPDGGYEEHIHIYNEYELWKTGKSDGSYNIYQTNANGISEYREYNTNNECIISKTSDGCEKSVTYTDSGEKTEREIDKDGNEIIITYNNKGIKVSYSKKSEFDNFVTVKYDDTGSIKHYKDSNNNEVIVKENFTSIHCETLTTKTTVTLNGHGDVTRVSVLDDGVKYIRIYDTETKKKKTFVDDTGLDTKTDNELHRRINENDKIVRDVYKNKIIDAELEYAMRFFKNIK